MHILDLIRKKQHGGALTPPELRFLVSGCTDGSIPDYQLSALLMAIWYSGMTDEETAALTQAMADSGDTLPPERTGARSVDKHSTGGVGDKTTPIVAPLAAAVGGTVDKLESIPGYRTSMPQEDLLRQAEQIGIAVIGQTGDLAPADKRLYALRDVTGTVDSIPLIAASIMSKKLAAGARSIVLDVKVGSGALMRTREDAERLARLMVAIGRHCGRRMTALLTDMSRPLGRAVGNALEIREAAAVLRGDPDAPQDLREVCLALAAEMAALSLDLPLPQAQQRVRQALDSGAGFAKMQQWVAAQGGDVRALDADGILPAAAHRIPVAAPRGGYLRAMDTAMIGRAAMLLGAGRLTKDDPIDPAAGIVLGKKTGDPVRAGEPLAVLHTDRPAMAAEAAKAFLSAVTLGDEPPAALPQPILSVIR